jgi:uncharacterized protein involved in exopolysaccharide biosynthesis
MSISQIWAILWARKWTAFAFVSAALMAALIAVQVLPRRYDAAAQIYFRLAERDPATDEQVPGVVQRNFLQTQIETIKSLGVALKVVDMMRLRENTAYKNEYMESTGGVGDFGTWIAAGLIPHLVVDRVGASDIISITFRDRDPKRAAQFANAYVSGYIAKSIELRTMPAAELAQWYDEQLTPIRQRLAALNSRRSELSRQGIAGKGAGAPASAEDERARLASEAQTARLELMQAKITLELAKAQGEVTDTDEIKQLRRQMTDLEAQIVRDSRVLGPEHLRIKTLRSNRAALDEQLSKAIKRASADDVVAAQRRVEAADRRLNEINVILGQDDRVAQTGDVLSLTSIQREIEALKLQMASIIQRGERLRMEAAVKQSLASRLTDADEPTAPSFPRRLLILGFALGLGLPFGLVLAFLREMLDRRIRVPMDITSYTDLPLLAVVPISRRSGVRWSLRQSAQFRSEVRPLAIPNQRIAQRITGHL